MNVVEPGARARLECQRELLRNRYVNRPERNVNRCGANT